MKSPRVCSLYERVFNGSLRSVNFTVTFSERFVSAVV